MFLSLLLVGFLDKPLVPPETPEQAKVRHERVADAARAPTSSATAVRRNTRTRTRWKPFASFELGADGNEFDIRKTKDGVLVVFHDDMLDRRLEAYGDVSDYSWEELPTIPLP